MAEASSPAPAATEPAGSAVATAPAEPLVATTPTPPSAKLPKPSTRSPRPAHRVANDFLRAIDAKVDVYSARPVFGQRAVQTQMIANASRSSSPRRSHYARVLSQSFAAESDVDGHHGDSPQPVHVYNPSIVGAFLSKAWAHHTQTIADSIKREGMAKLSTPPTRTPSTVRVTPAQQRAPIDYYSEGSVWSALETASAAGTLRLVSGKWLAKRYIEGGGHTEGGGHHGLPSFEDLPPRAFVSLEDLRRYHHFSDATPAVGGARRLPIVAVSRDLSEDDVETAEDDGNEADGSTGGGGSVALMSAVGRALAHFLPIYERPGGPRSGRRGVPDVGVFIDIASLPSGIDATAGATGAAITTLFAHKLVTVYFHADEALEYHGRSALYRHLARLCKGEGASPEDPWPAIVDLSQPERWPSAAELDSDNCTAIAPAYRIPLPPDAFEAGGDMDGEVMCSDGDEQIAIGRAYRQACEDAVRRARFLDFSMPTDASSPAGQPPLPMHTLAEDDTAMTPSELAETRLRMESLAALLPLCQVLEKLEIRGDRCIALPEVLGELPPPPRLPFKRGRPKANEASKYASLQLLDVSSCTRLARLPDGVSKLLNLRVLNVGWCSALQALPDEIGSLRELRTLVAKGCVTLRVLPESLSKLKAPHGTLERLELDFCGALEALPDGVGGLSSLQHLSLYGCRQLRALPRHLHGLLSLHRLNLSGCTSLIGKVPADVAVLEERGCAIQWPPSPPPPSTLEQPSYTLGALNEFAKQLYGRSLGEPDPAKEAAKAAKAAAFDQNATADSPAADGAASYTLGEIRLAAGDKYEGKTRGGKMEGAGTYTFADGRWYEGQWAAGKMDGSGTFHWHRGNEYTGQFKEGKPWGEGTRLYSDGDRYDGSWVSGKKHGRGTYQLACGDVFEGEFVDDLREGRGTYRYHDGETFDGEWHLDEYKPKYGLERGSPALLQLEDTIRYKMMLQENEEQRAKLRELRGGVPLLFRRNLKERVTEEFLRSENAKLAAYVRAHAHYEFLGKMKQKRKQGRSSRASGAQTSRRGGAEAVVQSAGSRSARR